MLTITIRTSYTFLHPLALAKTVLAVPRRVSRNAPIPRTRPCGGFMDSEFDAILFTCPLCEGWAMAEPSRPLVKCECCGELVEVPDVAMQDSDSRTGTALS
jgi:hypothetical protein